MKYTTITKENIHLIAFRIKQFIEKMEIIEKNKRIDYFVKEMDKELFKTKNPLNVLETYSKLAPYLQGRLDLEEALKQNKSYLNKNYGI